MERREAIKRMTLAMGYTLSASTLTSIASSCSSSPTLEWKPRYLTTDQAATVDALSEAILPKTETPGAKELGVPQFIDVLVGEVMPEGDRKKFIGELDGLMKDCQTSTGKLFHNCNPEQKKSFLDRLDAENNEKYPGIWGSDMVKKDQRNFFGRFRDMVVWGYFTTEVAGEQLLAYDPIPGKYSGCIPLSQVGKAWSLQ